MVKNLVAIVLVVVLVADIGLFVGIGFATGGLSIVASPPTGAQYTQQPFCTSEGITCYAVNFTNVAQGAPLITSPEQGQQSSDLSFGVYDYIASGSCTPGNERQDAWNGGATNYGTSSYYVIHFSQSVTGEVGGTEETGATWSFSVNSSVSQGVILAYCGWIKTLGNPQQAVYSTPGLQFPETLWLVGPYPSLTVSVDFYSQGQYCDGNPVGGSLGGACQAAVNNIANLNNQMTDNGAWSGIASASAVYQSAGASFSFVGQPYENGGTLTVSVNTGYDDGGYQLELICPSPRPCGGAVDTEFTPNPVGVPDNHMGYQVSWHIPSNAAQNNSVGPSWNTWLVVLETKYVASQISLTTIINPLYSPAQPVIRWTTGSGDLYPAVGDTLNLEVWANSSQLSGPAVTLDLAVYYQVPGQAAYQAPGCGNGWVTSCPYGTNVTLSSNFYQFSFTVNPPVGDTLIGVTAISGARNGQASPADYAQIAVKPSNCQPGTSCDPTYSQITLWEIVGPILLSIAIIVASLLVALYVPVTYARVLIVAAAVGAVAIFYVFDVYTVLFSAGGAFNSGQS
jgi:hypothetical protein